MICLTAEKIAEVVKGKVIKGDPSTRVQCVNIDSRSGLSPDGLFVPIIGARTDGHKYIAGAARAGAVCTFCSEEIDTSAADICWIQVEDTIRALQDLGIYLRNQIHVPVAAVAGSVGKTTTREMVALALSGRYRTFRTSGNFNSQLGVPIMVSRIPEDSERIVLEAGISNFGEMDQLIPLVQPDMVIYTNIGVTHIENLKTRDNIFREKYKLAQSMKPGSPLIVNGDNDYLGKLDASSGYQVVKYGFGENNDVRAFHVRMESGRNVFDADVCGQIITVRLQVLGEHMILNALAALAAAKVWDVPLEAAIAQLETFTGFAGRQVITQVKEMTLIEDYYNASPDSMKASLGVLNSLSCDGQKIAVLADMKELGEKEKEYHEETGRFAGKQSLTHLICVGELGRILGESAGKENPSLPVECFETNQEAFEALKRIMKKGDIILLKGSNSMNLKEISDLIKEK